MGIFSADIETMDDLFLHQLRDIYYAEKQIVKALPDMIAKATSEPLRQAFESHLDETHGQIARLEQVFDLLGQEASGTDCPAIDGIIEEANEISSDVADDNVLNAALAAAAQAVEHYEISRYGTLVAWGQELDREDCARLLRETLEEEKAADRKLTDLAEERLNQAA
ncbi:MAG: ferritin-like domain-containing protein [Rhodobacteraceae bacterium]|jgi:ferritin-like metal-binding protein YciE|nr:ferritin-like domain-containing protein [Paracoccaceae bacterium]